MRFEADQHLLQSAAKQLFAPEVAFEPRISAQADALGDQILLGSYFKSMKYGTPISDRIKEEINFMNPKQLAKLELKLTLTPERLAVRYIDWIHTGLGTHEPNPLPAWLKSLEREIYSRYANFGAHKIFRAAERQFLALVSLYASSLLGLIDAFCALLHWDALAATTALLRKPQDADRLRLFVEHRNNLLIWGSVIGIDENDYLGAPVLPADLRSLLRTEFLFRIAKSGVKSGKLLAPAECLKQAKAKIEVVFATALAKANHADCHEIVFRFAEARLRLATFLDDWKAFGRCITQMKSKKSKCMLPT
jgi:hypothetical protein